MTERQTYRDAHEGKAARAWHNRFGDTENETKNPNTFIQVAEQPVMRQHSDRLGEGTVTRRQEVSVFDATFAGIPDPRRVEHFIDAYTSIDELKPYSGKK